MLDQKQHIHLLYIMLDVTFDKLNAIVEFVANNCNGGLTHNSLYLITTKVRLVVGWKIG